jgi:precorrin-2/cobalt-factor-2 C20-methyltransferase
MKPTLGCLYGVGLGPGASDLLTLRAVRVIKACQVICVPASDDGHSYAWPIIADLIDRERQDVVFARFTMRREQAAVAQARQGAQEVVLEHMSQGRDVAFVTEGDPMLYSTFANVLRIVRQRRPDVRVEVVPGVSSINAAAAAACLPLGQGDDRIAILPAIYALEQEGGTDLPALVRAFDTVVLLKVSHALPLVLDMLAALQLEEHAVYVRRASTQSQEVITDFTGLRTQPADYFSLVIVRNPHAARSG